MIGVDYDTHYAAARFGILKRAGGVPRRTKSGAMGGYGHGEVVEFVTADGEVISRKVEAMGEVLCWLRQDLADEAKAALLVEAEDYLRVINELRDFIGDTDRQGAARNNTSVEAYRAQRHAAGARWDRYRAKQRAGY